MEFKLNDRVLRPLNAAIKPGEYIHVEELATDRKGKRRVIKHALCRFRGAEFMAPANTTVYQRALITRTTLTGTNEYVVVWYMNGLTCNVSLNRINPFFSPGMPGDEIFLTIQNEQEFQELLEFVIENKLDRLGVGDEVPYVVEEDPLGFNRV